MQDNSTPKSTETTKQGVLFGKELVTCYTHTRYTCWLSDILFTFVVISQGH